VTTNTGPPPPGEVPGAPSIGIRLWLRLRSVPVTVVVVIVMALMLGIIAVVAEVNRPDATEATSDVGEDRVVVAAGRPLPGAVDNSGVPGPTPAAAIDQSAVATVGGTVTMAGRVESAGEPLGNARVQLTRWVGERSASVVLETDTEGAFVGEGLVGGLWAITAWKEPQYRRAETQRVFLGDGQSVVVTIRPLTVDGISLEVEARPVADDDQVDVTVTANTQVVDADGEVVSVGATGIATVVYPVGHRGPGEVEVGGGRGQFVVACLAPAAGGKVTVTFDGQAQQVDVPGCERRATTTTTSPTTTLPPTPPSSVEPGRR